MRRNAEFDQFFPRRLLSSREFSILARNGLCSIIIFWFPLVPAPAPVLVCLFRSSFFRREANGQREKTKGKNVSNQKDQRELCLWKNPFSVNKNLSIITWCTFQTTCHYFMPGSWKTTVSEPCIVNGFTHWLVRLYDLTVTHKCIGGIQ